MKLCVHVLINKFGDSFICDNNASLVAKSKFLYKNSFYVCVTLLKIDTISQVYLNFYGYLRIDFPDVTFQIFYY